MKELDTAFLTVFKDLKITVDETNSGGKPAYTCQIGKRIIGYSEVVGLVKEYQDRIINTLLNENNSEA